jgi:hypothetical protein
LAASPSLLVGKGQAAGTVAGMGGRQAVTAD